MQLTYFINAVYAGHLNDESKLAGLGLGTCILESLTLYIIMGMNGALETLVAHAYGANQLTLCGVYLNRARVINTVIFIPLLTILLFTKPILTVLGQEPAVVDYATTFVHSNLLSVYFLSMYDMTKRFLNCLQTTWVPMVAQVVATLLHILWCHLFVVQWGWDMEGLGHASTLTSSILLASVMIYAHCLPHIKGALFWPDATVWHEWREYFALGVPTTGILCAEYWAWQFLAILSGNLGVNEQANMMIAMQIVAMLNTTSLGVSEAACVVIGNQIGANHVTRAKKLAKLTLIQAIGVAGVISAMLGHYGTALIGLFTNGESIDVTLVVSILPLFMLTNLVDMSSAYFMGCVRALGIQSNVALITIGCFYLISIPSSCYLTFVAGNGIKGLWIGYFLGIFVQMLIVQNITTMADW